MTLDDYKIRVEAAAAPRAACSASRFPKSDRSRIQIDLARRVGGTSTRQSVKVVDEHAIEGWMKCPPEGGGWGNGGGKANYTVYFRAEFSRPITHCGVWSADIPDGWNRKREDIESPRYRRQVAKAQVLDDCREWEGKHLGFFSEFATAEGEQVSIKVGISFVGIEGARANLAHDIDAWDFDKIRGQARAAWANALRGVNVEDSDAGPQGDLCHRVVPCIHRPSQFLRRGRPVHGRRRQDPPHRRLYLSDHLQRLGRVPQPVPVADDPASRRG